MRLSPPVQKALDILRDDLGKIAERLINASREARQADRTQHGPPPEIRAVLDAPQGIETRKSTAEAQADRTYQRRTLIVQWILCLATIGAFGAAAYYARVAKLQWQTMNATYDEIKQQTAAARRSAETARQTLEEIQKGGTDTHELAVQAKNQADRTKDVADRTLAQAIATNKLATISQRQQRPYLWAIPQFKQADAVIFRERGNQVEIGMDVGIRNGGLSPAIKVVVSVPVITIEPANWPPGERALKESSPLYPPKDEGSIIGPNSSITAKALPQPADALTMEMIHGGEGVVYLFGAVTYTDIYQPDSRPYETTYCFILKPQSLGPLIALLPGGFPTDTAINCPFGNHFK